MLDLLAELTGLTGVLKDILAVHLRIAEALERISPPLPDAPSPVVRPFDEREGFHLAESGEEYEARLSQEAALAAEAGVVPWNPAFKQALEDMRAEMMKTSYAVKDEQGNWTEIPPPTREEADEAIRAGFRAAKAEANER